MKVFLVDDSAADYFFDKVTEIEKLYDTYSIFNLAADTECHQTGTIIALVNFGRGG